MGRDFPIPKLKRAYSQDFKSWNRDTVGYWFEIDHSHEGHRLYKDTVELYLNDYNWAKILKPNTTVIDIGGHSGDTAVIMGAMTGGTVLTVECNPVIYPWLEFCCEMNRHTAKFIVAPEAVTTEDNVTVTFSDHNNNMCNGGLVDHAWAIGPGPNSINVPGMRLDSLCDKYLNEDEIANIDLIKTDTEGHDMAILDSSREFIDRIRPKLFVEWFSGFDQARSDAMFDIIESMGYVAYYPKTLTPANPDDRSEDLLLIHKTKIKESL